MTFESSMFSFEDLIFLAGKLDTFGATATYATESDPTSALGDRVFSLNHHFLKGFVFVIVCVLENNERNI